MKVFILAGGAGTRLHSVISDRPKSMAPIHSLPFLSYQLAEMKNQGFDEFVLCIGYKHQFITEYYGDGESLELSINYSIERNPLGTAGAIRLASDFIEDETFMVMNGDTFVNADFPSMVAHHKALHAEDGRFIGTILSSYMTDASSLGTLELSPCGTIEGFHEKIMGSGWANAGVYILESDILSFIPAGKISIENEVFPAVIKSEYKLSSFPALGVPIDIGTPEGYRKFQEKVKVMGVYDGSGHHASTISSIRSPP